MLEILAFHVPRLAVGLPTVEAAHALLYRVDTERGLPATASVRSTLTQDVVDSVTRATRKSREALGGAAMRDVSIRNGTGKVLIEEAGQPEKNL